VIPWRCRGSNYTEVGIAWDRLYNALQWTKKTLGTDTYHARKYHVIGVAALALGKELFESAALPHSLVVHLSITPLLPVVAASVAEQLLIINHQQCLDVLRSYDFGSIRCVKSQQPEMPLDVVVFDLTDLSMLGDEGRKQLNQVFVSFGQPRLLFMLGTCDERATDLRIGQAQYVATDDICLEHLHDIGFVLYR
jgi:hypothetical protein